MRDRPHHIACARCHKTVHVAPVGRLPIYCTASCRTAACMARRGRDGSPSAEEKQRLVAWILLIDAGIVPPGRPVPPMRRVGDAA